MRRVGRRIEMLESRTRERGRNVEGWRVVLGPFVGTGNDDLDAGEAAALASRLAATGERPTFAALTAACQAVAEEAARA